MKPPDGQTQPAADETAAAVDALKRLGFAVRRVGQGTRNPEMMYCVRKGARGRDEYLTETQLRERAGVPPLLPFSSPEGER